MGSGKSMVESKTHKQTLLLQDIPIVDTLLGAGCAASVHFDRCCLLGQYGHTQTA